jgi:hypothetical protein
MKSLLRSLNTTNYRSTVQCNAKAFPGVEFMIRKISLGRRIELAQAIRELSQELEFQQAGNSTTDQVEAATLSARIDQVYLRWGLLSISGLRIDGEPPSADSLFSSGPESLLREIVDRVKAECGLTDDERKN